MPEKNEPKKTELQEKQDNTIEAVPYTDFERDYWKQLVSDLVGARDQRERSWEEFDDMSYSQWYDNNRRKDLAHVAKKKNKYDVRVTTGVTREKDTSLLSSFLNLNLEPNIKAYGEDQFEIVDLGEDIEDAVIKSRLIEDYKDKRIAIYREFISQGDVFVEEVWHEEYGLEKILKNDNIKDEYGKVDTEKIEWVQRNVLKKAMCRSNLLDGRKVLLGNIRTEIIDDQDMVATYEAIPRSQAKALYGNFDRWNYVPYAVESNGLPSEIADIDNTTWNLFSLEKDFVGVLKIQKKYANEYQIMLNGVMMLPAQFPLTAISPTGDYTISQGKLEVISHFAYSKSQPGKMRFDQEIVDEFYKLAVEKMRQSFKPTLGTKSKKRASDRLFVPGAVVRGVSEDEFFPIHQYNQGLTAGEFSFLQMVQETINQKSLDPVVTGGDPGGDVTATEFIGRKEQQMLKLGAMLDGLKSLERQMVWRRVYNILQNWTSGIDEKIDQAKENAGTVYRRESIDKSFADGKQGTKVLEFTEGKNFMDVTELQKKEDEMSKFYGKQVRISQIDPVELRALKAFWYVTMQPNEESTDKLSQILFIQNLGEAMQMFGQESVNQDHAKKRFAQLIGEDYDKFFNTEQSRAPQLPQQRSARMGGGNPVAAGLKGAAKNQQPTANIQI